MPAKTGSRNGLSYGWALGENNWNTGMDGNLTFIDRFGVHLSFKSFLNTPPGSPAAGDCHVIDTAPTGVWAGKAGQVAVYDDGAWRYGVPRTGWRAYCEADERLYVYDGGWAPTASEWSEDTVPQAEAEAGTATTRRAWTAQRVRQAIEASPVRGSLDLRTANVTLAQSSNYIVNSENFSAANISPNRALVRSTGVLAPNDTLTAERITDTTSVNQQSRIIFVAPTFGSSATINMSMFIKPFGNITHVSLYPSVSSKGALVSFDLTTLTGTVNNVSGGVGTGEIRQHKNGYFRLSVSLTLPAPATSINTWLYFAPGPTGNTSYTGNGNSGVDIWGLQFTPGLDLLPYVRTAGAAVVDASVLHSAGTVYHTAPTSIFSNGLAQAPTRSTVASGSTIVLTPITSHLLYDQAATVAALTVTLPSADLTNGQIINICTRSDITALTINGGTIYGAPTTLTAGGFCSFIYSSAAGAWFRKG